MYEAPDRYKRMISARLPDGESLGVTSQAADEGSSPLRDAQLIARGQFAPFFAAVNSVAAVFMAMILYGHVPTTYLGGWVLAVITTNLGAMQLARTQAVTHVGRSGRKVPKWLMVGDISLRALAWLSLPVISFTSIGPQSQAVAATLIAGLGIAALGLVVVPACVTAWMSIFTAALCYSLLVAGNSVPFDTMLAIIFTLGVAIVGVLTVARWAFGQLKTNADFGSQSASASLLLQEYEQRGVGWLWQVDGENRVTYISSRMTALLGRPASALLGHSLPSLLGGHAELGRVLLEKQPFSNLEMELQTARGARWISIAGDPIVDTAGRFEGFRGVGSDITEIRQTQERLTHLANVDVLSGLPNRGRVRQLLGEALRQATVGNVPCAIMFLDLDGFKPVNDTFGHPKGDAVLQAVAKRLCDQVGPDGHVGRMGGDEFAIVIADAQSRNKVEQLAEGIINAIKEPYMIDQTEIRIGVSIGCAFGPIDGATVDDLDPQGRPCALRGQGRRPRRRQIFLVGAADRAGRSCPPGDGSSGCDRCKAVPPRFPAAGQRQDAETGRLRSTDPLEPPAARLRPAERFHTRGGRKRPDADHRRMGHRRGDPGRGNLAGTDYRRAQRQPEADHPAVAAQHRQPGPWPLQAAGQPPGTGSDGGRVPGRQRHRRWMSSGVYARWASGIALDDFGTGYSSIGYLNKAVFHKLKIDGSFVREAGSRQENVAIIQSIVQLAKSFRMSVTAEGVETAEDFERMRELGCDTIQGYLFGRPLSYERANQMVLGLGAKRMAG